jgi:hypothetical protein
MEGGEIVLTCLRKIRLAIKRATTLDGQEIVKLGFCAENLSNIIN